MAARSRRRERHRRRARRRARQLAALLRGAGIPAIAGVDTRALARRLRETGCQRAIVMPPGALDPQAAIDAARGVTRWEDQDYVGEVSPVDITEIGDPADGGPLIAIVDLGLK
jgi:carbamoyl-phosphate synthase small subunit